MIKRARGEGKEEMRSIKSHSAWEKGNRGKGTVSFSDNDRKGQKMTDRVDKGRYENIYLQWQYKAIHEFRTVFARVDS